MSKENYDYSDWNKSKLIEEITRLNQNLNEIKVKQLNERIKELRCIYSVSGYIEKNGNNLEDILKGIVSLIPQGWQYPEITCCRIIFKEQTYTTNNFYETPWFMKKAIMVFGKVEGYIEIFYLQECPNILHGPFLLEEENLITELAEKIGKVCERIIYARQLQNNIQEKDLLLKELHHRVKNNLQVISGLITLQMDKITDPNSRIIFKDFQNRIKTMAQSHDMLCYNVNLGAINIAKYIEIIVRNAFQSHQIDPNQIRISFDLSDLNLPFDIALNCGLIINELVTNSLKHAFIGKKQGTIIIMMKKTLENLYVLEVIDDGVGFHPDLENNSPKTLGLYLVKMLAQKIHAKLSFVEGKGTNIHLEWN